MELRKHRKGGAVAQVLRGEIPSSLLSVSQQIISIRDLNWKVGVYVGKITTTLRSHDAIQSAEHIVIQAGMLDSAERIQINSIQLPDTDQSLRLPHSTKIIFRHLSPTCGVAFGIQLPVDDPEVLPHKRMYECRKNRGAGRHIDSETTKHSYEQMPLR